MMRGTRKRRRGDLEAEPRGEDDSRDGAVEDVDEEIREVAEAIDDHVGERRPGTGEY